MDEGGSIVVKPEMEGVYGASVEHRDRGRYWTDEKWEDMVG